MAFELTRGEIILVAIIFTLIYGAGLLPRLAARLSLPTGGAARERERGRESSGGA